MGRGMGLRGAGMIDINSWPLYVKLALGLGWIVIGLPGCMVLAYTTHRYYARIMSAFPNSPGVRCIQMGFKGFSFHSRCTQVAMSAGFILGAKLYISRGYLDPVDSRNFPPEIKRLMVISMSLMGTGFTWLMLLWGCSN